MTKHEAMIQYVSPKVKSLIGRTMPFNFADESSGSISFLTNYSGKVVKRYTRAADKEYGFTIVLTWAFSESTDDLNLSAMNFAQSFMDWIDEQNSNKIVPDFGEGCQVKKIENLQNMPNLASIDWENMTARYMIQCRVLYFERGR